MRRPRFLRPRIGTTILYRSSFHRKQRFLRPIRDPTSVRSGQGICNRSAQGDRTTTAGVVSFKPLWNNWLIAAAANVRRCVALPL